MKSFLLFVTIVAVTSAFDNGQYRPQQYVVSAKQGNYVHTPISHAQVGSVSGKYSHTASKSNPVESYIPENVTPYTGHKSFNPSVVNHVTDSNVKTVPKVASAEKTSVPIVEDQHSSEGHSAILRSESDMHPDGSFHYSFETENGIKVAEQATVQLQSPDVSVQKRTGFFEYQSPEGPIRIDFIADENGFQPIGKHIPTPPPVPDAIARLLVYLRDVHE